MLCVLMKILSHAGTKKKKKSLRVLNLILNFNRSLLCDIMAVKGLKQTFKGEGGGGGGERERERDVSTNDGHVSYSYQIKSIIICHSLRT